MPDIIRGRLGSFEKARYFEETATKSQAFYVSVVHTERVQNPVTKDWEDGQETWFNAPLFGANAEWAKTQLLPGDNVLIFGEVTETEKIINGHPRTSRDIKVAAIALDPHLNSSITYTRAPRPNREQVATQTIDADPEPAVFAAPVLEEPRHEFTPIDMATAETFLRERVNGARKNGYISEEQATRIAELWTSSKTDQWKCQAGVSSILHETDTAVHQYVTSVTDAYAGKGEVLTWEAAVAKANEIDSRPAPAEAHNTQPPPSKIEGIKLESPLPAPVSKFDSEPSLLARARELIEVGRLQKGFDDMLARVFRESAPNVVQIQKAVRDVLTALPTPEREYLGTVVDQEAGVGFALTWAECEKVQIWETVTQARQETRGQAEATNAMAPTLSPAM